METLENELAGLHIRRPAPGRSVSVADFGAKPDGNSCNYKAFARALVC